MKLKSILLGISFTMAVFTMNAQKNFETDTIKTKKGDLEITLLGHGTLMFKYNNKVIHIDPFSKMADYTKLPKADLVLITHSHFDHLDPKALVEIVGSKTPVLAAPDCKGKLDSTINVTIMENGDKAKHIGLKIESIPAYNIVNKPKGGGHYHQKGQCNGYVLSIADKRIYVAGDTENVPEMKALKDIDVAFLPINLPYTMNAEMVKDAVEAFKPKVLYPYHHEYGETDIDKLADMLKDVKGTELRMREK